MERIEDITVEKMENSLFLRPFRVSFKQGGATKFWDLIRSHSSVSILIFNVTRKVFVFVKQLRMPVLISRICADENRDIAVGDKLEHVDGSKGFTIELCAGIVDREKPLEEIAVAEVEEECGYKVPSSRLERLFSFPASVGSAGDIQTLFFTTVTDSERVSAGGGLADEGEMIEVVEMTVEQVKAHMSTEHVNSPVGFLFAVNWFLNNKTDLYQS